MSSQKKWLILKVLCLFSRLETVYVNRRVIEYFLKNSNLFPSQVYHVKKTRLITISQNVYWSHCFYPWCLCCFWCLHPYFYFILKADFMFFLQVRKYFLELLFIPPSIDCYTLLLLITFFFSGDAGICDGLLPSHAGEKETLICGWMSISLIAYPSLFWTHNYLSHLHIPPLTLSAHTVHILLMTLVTLLVSYYGILVCAQSRQGGNIHKAWGQLDWHQDWRLSKDKGHCFACLVWLVSHFTWLSRACGRGVLYSVTD